MPTRLGPGGMFGQWYGTPALEAVFSEATLVQRYLDVEAALARVQARLSIIPADAAREIERCCRVEAIDLPALRARTAVVGFPIVGLVEQLSAVCAAGAGEFAHWGATTQDIMDTADILQFRDALHILQGDLDAIACRLAELAREHRDTVMVGRTHIQHALPITFGYKAAVWLSAIDRHRVRLDELRARLLMGQFGGAVGTLASLGSRGLEVQTALMAELGLAIPAMTWHAARDTVAEMTGWFALLTGSVGKIGLDVVLMSITEIDEVREPFVTGRGSSSTMPQKRNPVVSEMLMAIARQVNRLHGGVVDAMLNDHERGGASPWQAEWPGLAEGCMLTGAALAHARELLTGLEVRADRMSVNLHSSRGLIAAEAVMMALAPALGRQTAHDLIVLCCREAVDSGAPLIDALCACPDIAAVMSRDALTAAMDPASYLGVAGEMIDRYLVGRDAAEG